MLSLTTLNNMTHPLICHFVTYVHYTLAANHCLLYMLCVCVCACAQRMLLQDLHDRHVCNSLLVAESEEDIWKTESVYRKRLNTSDGEPDERAASARSLFSALI